MIPSACCRSFSPTFCPGDLPENPSMPLPSSKLILCRGRFVLREMSSMFVFPRSAMMPALSGHRLPFADPDTVVPAAGQTFQQR